MRASVTLPAILRAVGVAQTLDCPAENSLAAFAERTLDAERTAWVEEHVDACAACRGALVQLASALATGRRSRSGEVLTDSPAPPSSTRIEKDQQIGRYVIERLVGVGGMGTVFAARDPDLHRVVALKLLRAGLADGRAGAKESLRTRLLQEARAMARLSHPNVITVHDVGTFGTQLFVAMELVDGGTLRHWLASRARSWREVLATFRQAGSGLAAAHAAGLVHRDFKPDNVLVGSDGRVRVTDFGLARAIENVERGDAPAPREPIVTGSLDVGVTYTAAIVGTPAYMAPEQLDGDAADARSDLFAFCVALYEALYGARPFEGRSIAELRATMRREQVRPAPRSTDVPTWVRRVVLTGLREPPRERYESMGALLEALREGPLWGRRQAIGGGAAIVVAALAAAGALRGAAGGAVEAPPRGFPTTPAAIHAAAPTAPTAAEGSPPLVGAEIDAGPPRVAPRAEKARGPGRGIPRPSPAARRMESPAPLDPLSEQK